MSIIYINPYRFAAAGPTDPYFNNVSLLLHGDGINGSTTIVDSSPSPKTVTAFGDAQISTAQSKFGGASIAFDGSGDYLTIPYVANNYRWWDTDFTIEAWMYADNLLFTEYNFRPFMVGNMSPTSHTNYWSFGTDRNGRVRLYYFTGDSLYISSDAGVVSSSSWTHIAMCQSSGNVKLFANGTLVANESYVGTPRDSGGTPLTFGLLRSVGYNGYIDDVRITRGVARYTSNFTPPTAPFPDA